MNACRWNKVVLASCLTLCALPVLALMLLLQPTAEVPHPGPLSEQQRQQVEQLLVDNSPPRLQGNGSSHISLDADELNLLLHFAMSQLPLLDSAAARANLEGPHLQLTLSRSLFNLPSPVLNVDAQLALEGNQVSLQRLRTGWLVWPRGLNQWLWQRGEQWLAAHHFEHGELPALEQPLRDLRLEDQRLQARLEWQSDTLEDLRQQAQYWLISEDDRTRLIHYYRLTQQLAAATEGGRPTLQDLLPALFNSAGQRSAEDPLAATTENRALLQALTLYVNQLDPGLLIHDVPQDLQRASPRQRVTLRGRHDLSRHFVTSAAIAASAGATIAEVLANSKELHDARYSTGFSFSDVMANMAGLRLGQQAIDTATASRLQQRLRQATAEADYMPPIASLEDGLSEHEFAQRYGSRDSALFRQQIESFDRQINELSAFRQ